MACQWQTCQFWCLVENGNQFAWCWTKASHSLTCRWAARLRSFCWPASWTCYSLHKTCPVQKPWRCPVPSWRSWTACAVWIGCRYGFMLPTVTRALTKIKTRGKSVRRNNRLEHQSVVTICKTIPFWGDQLFLSWHCTCCDVIYTKAGEIDSHWFILPDWTAGCL